MVMAEYKSKFPSRWNDNKTAGIDWLQSFMKRRKNRKFCKHENTSLVVATVLIKHKEWRFLTIVNVHLNLGNLLLEAGVSTVVRSPNIFAQLGTKQVG